MAQDRELVLLEQGRRIVALDARTNGERRLIEIERTGAPLF